MRRTRLLVISAILIIAACASAYATPGYQLILRNPMPAVTGYIWTTGMSGFENCYIGPVTLEVRQLNATTGAYDLLGYQRTLCVDVLGTIANNCVWYADAASGVPNAVMGADAAARSANWDRIVWTAQNNPGWTLASGTGAFNAVQNAGIQTAVWEMLRDGSNFNLSSGNFKLGSTSVGAQVASSAQAFFDSSSGYTPGYAANATYYKATNWTADGKKITGQYGQDQLFFIPDYHQPGPDVPEIPTALLGPLGLIAVGFLRRKFAR